MKKLALGTHARVRETGEEGILIATLTKSGWLKHAGMTQKRIRIYSLLLDSGEVRFFIENALESS